MNEVKRVHLGRQQFVISIDAHRELRKYLDDISEQPGVQEEVVKEVEARMAELLIERGITGDKVVLPDDIHELKRQLGEPADFKDEDSIGADPEDMTQQAESGQNGPKKLFRDTDNAWLAGVASGLAAYTGIDVLIIRIIFIILTFGSGVGVVAYIIIWLLAPEAKTPSDRLQMRGKAVTVDSLKQMVERADLAGVSDRAGKHVGRAAGKLAETFAKSVLYIIGAIFITAGIVIMLWSIATCAYLLVHGGQIGTEIAFPLGSHEVWLTILGSVTTGLLGFFFLMSGLAMTTRKWRLPTWIVVSLVSVFLVSAGIAGALAADTVPKIRDRYQQAHHTESRQLATFSNITLKGEDTVMEYVADERYWVEVSYLGKVDTKPLVTDVDNGILTIDGENFSKHTLCAGFCFYSDHDLKVTVHAPKLDIVTLQGNENTFLAEKEFAVGQQDLQLRVDRRSENFVRLANVSPSEISVDDTNPNEQIIKLRQPLVGAMGGTLTYSDEDANLLNAKFAIKTFNLATTAECDESEPRFYLGQGSQSLTIAGQTVNGNQLRDMRSPDKSNIYNCVVVR